ncbi:unnamed protein product [Durusdinium trenchii]|uniref:Uncharacterized protein n=1 Tax=Durusdinium trenchii TaxID=1381693 RepID=A0ABP0RXC5_9DINO
MCAKLRDASCLSPIAAKLNRQEYTMLLDSLKLLELPPFEKGDGAKETDMVVLEKAESLPTGLEKQSKKGNPPAPALEKAGKNKRLKQQSSDVSMDALGYPVMFASSPEDLGKGPSLGKLPVSKQRPGHRLFAEAEDLQNALGCAQYHGVISKIKAALEKDWLTKDEARQLREDLCHKHGC